MTAVTGEPFVMAAGAACEAQYDVPPDAWYFAANRCPRMPFSVLLEVALQPCGWLASFVGSALSSEEDLSFRNLDGNGKVLCEVLPDSGPLRTKVKLRQVSRSAGMIIESFDVTMWRGEVPVYTLDTTFGFFPAAALDNQVGLPVTPEQRSLLEAPAEPGEGDHSDLLVHGEPRRLGRMAARLLELFRGERLLHRAVESRAAGEPADGPVRGAGVEAQRGQERRVRVVLRDLGAGRQTGSK